MNIVDIFRDNAFSMTSMTEALEKVYKPSSELLTSGLFTPLRINTPHFFLDVRERHFNILPMISRGEPIPQRTFKKGAKVAMDTFKIGEGAKLTASELAYLLTFGTTDKMISAAQTEIAMRQQALLDDIDATREHMYLAALDGKLLDKDGTVIEDFFDLFKLTRPAEIALPLSTAQNGDLRQQIESTIVRPMRRAAAGARFTQIQAWCGDDAWDRLMKNPEVRETFKIQMQGAELRGPTIGTTLEFAGVTWRNYVEDDTGVLKIDEDEIKFIPAGQGNTVFRDVIAPGESFDDLGSYGKDIYARVMIDEKRNEFIETEAMTYRTTLCTRPEMLRFGKAS